MSKDKPRILIVDDELKIVSSLTAILKSSGYQILSASNGTDALIITEQEYPELILLDLLMPGLDGYETCRMLRNSYIGPIIIVTALSEESNMINGLEAGADDYLTKPFSTNELLARIHSALRRTSHYQTPSVSAFRSGGLHVDYVSSRVYIHGSEVRLTHTEYSVLCQLTRNAGRVVSTKTILENVWGAGYVDEKHLVQRVMNRLRAKVDADADKPRLIITRPGLGYMIEKEDVN